MKRLAVLLIAAALAGCATSRPQVHETSHVQKALSKNGKEISRTTTEGARSENKPDTPNQVVRHRWYDRFKVHPSKWFHKR